MKPASILLVEDDATTAQATSTLLELGGHRVVWSPSIEAACFQMLPPSIPFDLLLLDLGLGVDRGEDLVKYATKAEIPLPPILIVSAQLPERCSRVAREIKAAGVLSKPHSAQELLQAIEQAIAPNA